MRVLVLGGAGMLGHKLVQRLGQRFEVWTTVRGAFSDYARFEIFSESRTITGVDVLNSDSLLAAFARARPDVVVNAVGIVKQLRAARDPILSLSINSLLPHRLANICGAAGARLLTMSTDCVFNGKKGMYKDDDSADADDLYGRTKFLGEVERAGCVTLRTSIIGRELSSAHGMVEWFLSNRGGAVKGFRRAIYSGFPTVVMADIMADLIEKHESVSGVFNLSSEPVNKYELLQLLRTALQADVEIEADEQFEIDRSLDSARFRTLTGFMPQTWPEMVNAMALDQTPYDRFR